MGKARDRRRTLDGFAEINHDAAGIDVGNAQHWVAVPAGRDAEPVRMFGCFTADLYALANWLERCGINTVAMESTGRIARGVGQVRVVGEIFRGILLGPSVLGRLAPGLWGRIFPAGSLGSLDVLSTVGLILFLFLVGSELDLEHLRR